MSSFFIRKRRKKYLIYLKTRDAATGAIKQIHQGSFDKKKDAQNHLSKLKVDMVTNMFVHESELTFIDYVNEYIDSNEDGWAVSTIKKYRLIAKNQFISHFADVKLQNVSPMMINDYYNKVKKDYAIKTIKVHEALLKSSLKRAYKLRMIPSNPCDFVDTPKKKDTFESNAYTKSQIDKLLSASTGTPLEIPILIALTGGLRCSEICGLTWDDIDFDTGMVSVNKIMYVDKGEITFQEPKTESSIRELSLPKEMIFRLRQHKRTQNQLKLSGKLVNEHNLVSFTSKYKPATPNYVSKHFKKLLEDNKLEHIRFHDLRHTNATQLLLAGVDIKVVSTRLGHSTIKTTYDTYAHVLKEQDTSASEKLANAIFG